MNTHRPTTENPALTAPVRGRRIDIGTGFSALSFGHKQFDGLMDPLVMVDHFMMTEPTFEPHAHAGMSAVTVLLEDSQGLFRNRDSLGHDIDLEPGDLYWLKAARGAVHDEGPRPGAQTHALQVFVNLPAVAKHDAPDSLHVRAQDMPELRGQGYRVRVVLGESNGALGVTSPARPLTILDAHLEAGAGFTHVVSVGAHAWIHAIRGSGQVIFADTAVALRAGESVAVRGNDVPTPLEMRSEEGAEFVFFQGQPIRERIAQRGPFVMNTWEELAIVAAADAAGKLGSID